VAEKKLPLDHGRKISAFKEVKKRGRTGKVVKIFFALLVFLLLITGGAAAAVVVNYVNEAPSFDPSRLATVETSYIYDRDGKEVASLHDEQNRIAVRLNNIPQHVQLAFIAIEDERFEKHFGFDFIGSLRAAYANFRAGTIVQGASTITQQLAQNAFLTTETSYKRKVQEIWLALQLERIYVKDEILEMYLNRIYFGNGAYGVEAAAQTYYDKSVGDLTVAEAAMLAGAVRSPNFYNPIDNEFEAEARMRTVLSSMKRLGYISEAEYGRALREEIFYAEPPNPDYPYPHFVDYVVHDELIRILSEFPSIGSREEAYRVIYTGGLRVYTTLDPGMQSHVEEVLSRTELYPTTVYLDMPGVKEAVASLPAGVDLTRAQLQELVDEEGGVPQPQAAIVLADPATGQISALGGGREYRKKVDEVLRFSTLRQPGSAIKPIITYAPALEEGVLAGAGSTLDDSPFTGPQGWRPKNFDNRFRGFIPARDALYFSYNVPAVRAFQALGPRVGVGYAERMGISTIDPSEIDNLALTLGGFTYGVSAIDMAQAYSVLANDGVRVDLYTIEKIEDSNGAVIYEHWVNPRQVLSPQTTFIVNDILQDFVRKYLGRALQIDRPVAAKSGTTENWKDVYLVAYTPNLVASFWMGYDEPKSGSIQQGWRYSTAFLREVFLEAFTALEVRDFVRPEGIVRLEVCTISGLRPIDICRAAGTVRADYFIEKYAPRMTCHIHAALLPDPDEIDDDPDLVPPGDPIDDPGTGDPPPDNGGDPEPDPPPPPPDDQEPPAPPDNGNGSGGGGGAGGGNDNGGGNWWEDFLGGWLRGSHKFTA
jgi:penicillin-binding protein 1A